MKQKKSNLSVMVNLGRKKQTPRILVLFTFLFGALISVYGNSNNFSLENASSSINQIILKGMITDDMGSPLPGATIVEKGSANGTTSDFEGSFSITVSDSDSMIQVSYIGFDSVEVSANDFTDNMVISLTESSSALDEIVVTGYGRQIKRNITGAVSSISVQQIENLPLASFENAIQGQMAGVQVTEPSGAPGAGASVRVRGIGSISAGNEPLYVIDRFSNLKKR